MRPVEHKLKYQIEKYLKLATAEKYDESDPLQFKANPNNLVVEVLFKKTHLLKLLYWF